MTRSERSAGKTRQLSLLILIVLLPLIRFHAAGQNIYDPAHTREFAAYLMQSRQYQLASAEWERVLFFSPADSVARLNLVKAFRLSDQPQEGLRRISLWFPQGPLPLQLSREALQLTLALGDFKSFNPLLDRSNGLTETEKSEMRLGAWLMEGSWISEPAKKRQPGFPVLTSDKVLLDLYAKTSAIHRKSPAGAVLLSCIVPGLGKAYAGDWKDGIISLLFVATNAWQSYRGFSKNGISSVSGWIFGTLAAGFYTANLFGSWKSARDYNSIQTDRIRHEAEDILFTR